MTNENIEYIHEDIPKLLSEMEAIEVEPGLWKYCISDRAFAYVDFRKDKSGNPKGRRMILKIGIDGKTQTWITDTATLDNNQFLTDFKTRRDELVTIKLLTLDATKTQNKNNVEPNKRMNAHPPSENVPAAAPQELTTAAATVPSDTSQEPGIVTQGAPQTPSVRISPMIKNFVPIIREVGKIKIGKKGEEKISKKNGKKYRELIKFNHFVITTMLKDKNNDFIPDSEVMKQIGEDCKELKVTLMSNTPIDNFATFFAEYNAAGKRVCYGDGETAIENGIQKNCNPSECETFQKKKCKLNGILSVNLIDSPRFGGVYKHRTTGYNSVKNIMSSLFYLHNLTGGFLAGIPLMLTVSPLSTKTKTGMAVDIYTVGLEFKGTQEELANAVEKARDASKRMLGIMPTLNVIEEETAEEIKDVAEEFYPEVEQ